jgi:hypothetical protein
MCFITHSPFILSDIPQHNILFLQVDENEKKSLPRKESIKTFGANINDMLANGFYLQDGFMGEFAKNKLEDIIKNLNKVDKEENNSDVNEILKIIELIGEPFLREKLKEMFFNKFKELRSKRIQELEKELTKLKRYDWAKNGQQ